MEHIRENGEENGHDHEYDDNHLVLLLEVSHGALAHILGYLLHCRCPFILLFHLPVGIFL